MNGAFDRLCATRVLDDPEREAAWDRRRRAWPAEEQERAASERFPPGPEPGPEIDEARAQLIARAGELAERARTLLTDHFDPGPSAAARRLQALLALEQELRRTLGELLAELRARRAWHALGFHSIRHYAEARLGMSRSSAEDAARLARALPFLPVVKDAYDANRLSTAAALRVVRVLGRGFVPADLQRAWAEHAATTTIKRLDDERDLLRERRLLRTADPSAPVIGCGLARLPQPGTG